MADEANSQATEQSNASEAAVEQTTTDSATVEQTEETTSQTQAQDGQEDQKSEDKSQDKSEDKSPNADSGDKEKTESKDLKPRSRRSAAFRIQQLTKENNDLKQQLNERGSRNDGYAEDIATDDKPDIASLVEAEVDRRLNPVITESQKAADDAEINELFAGKDEERSKYEPKIRSMWNLSQYKDVAASDLLNMLRGSEMDNIIAQAKQDGIAQFKQAETEAKESSASGNSSNSNRTGNQAKQLTDQELLDQNEKIKAGVA